VKPTDAQLQKVFLRVAKKQCPFDSSRVRWFMEGFRCGQAWQAAQKRTGKLNTEKGKST